MLIWVPVGVNFKDRSRPSACSLCQNPCPRILPEACRALTLWLWKLATAFSAHHFSENANSAVTEGRGEVTRQVSIGPEIGSIADWISAAVVPGAKLLPITTKGPEAPLIVMPVGAGRTVAWAWPDSIVDWIRSVFGRR